VFFVVDCEDKELELSITTPLRTTEWPDKEQKRGDDFHTKYTRLSKGESFCIPRGNMYWYVTFPEVKISSYFHNEFQFEESFY
jgi:hypothetical protein